MNWLASTMYGDLVYIESQQLITNEKKTVPDIASGQPI